MEMIDAGSRRKPHGCGEKVWFGRCVNRPYDFEVALQQKQLYNLRWAAFVFMTPAQRRYAWCAFPEKKRTHG
jgi:hypothetical protein